MPIDEDAVVDGLALLDERSRLLRRGTSGKREQDEQKRPEGAMRRAAGRPQTRSDQPGTGNTGGIVAFSAGSTTVGLPLRI